MVEREKVGQAWATARTRIGVAFVGNQDHGGGAIADERAIVEVERIRNGLAGHGLFESDDFSHLSVGIERAVFVVLDGDGGQVFALRSVLIHVSARDHAEE